MLTFSRHITIAKAIAITGFILGCATLNTGAKYCRLSHSGMKNFAHAHDSCHDRLFGRNLRGEQHHPRLGLSHMLPNEREEGVFSSDRQLPGCRIFYLDTVHVAEVR